MSFLFILSDFFFLFLFQSRASLVSSSDGGILAEGESSSEYSCGSNSPPCDLGLVERLLLTHPVWFLPGIQRAGAVHLLQGKEEGVSFYHFHMYLIFLLHATNMIFLSFRLLLLFSYRETLTFMYDSWCDKSNRVGFSFFLGKNFLFICGWFWFLWIRHINWGIHVHLFARICNSFYKSLVKFTFRLKC